MRLPILWFLASCSLNWPDRLSSRISVSAFETEIQILDQLLSKNPDALNNAVRFSSLIALASQCSRYNGARLAHLSAFLIASTFILIQIGFRKPFFIKFVRRSWRARLAQRTNLMRTASSESVFAAALKAVPSKRQPLEGDGLILFSRMSNVIWKQICLPFNNKG